MGFARIAQDKLYKYFQWRSFVSSGVLGIKVKIMLPWDPTGKTGPKKPLPDHVSIVEPKEEVVPATPMSEHKGGKPEQPAVPINI